MICPRTLVSGDMKEWNCVHVNTPIRSGRNQKRMTRFNKFLPASNTIPENSKWQLSSAPAAQQYGGGYAIDVMVNAIALLAEQMPFREGGGLDQATRVRVVHSLSVLGQSSFLTNTCLNDFQAGDTASYGSQRSSCLIET